MHRFHYPRNCRLVVVRRRQDVCLGCRLHSARLDCLDDSHLARKGDVLELRNIRQALADGLTELTVRLSEGDKSFKVRLNFSPRERRMLNNGGLLAHIRQGGRPLSHEKAVSGAVDQGSPHTSNVPEDAPTV